MNNVKLNLQAASCSLLGGILGYGSVLVCPTMAPIAGIINGSFFGFTISSMGDLFSEANKREASARKVTEAVIATLASITLSFLVCLSLHIPITFTACVLFPWQMCAAAMLIVLPIAIISAIARQVHNIYLKLNP